MKITVTLANGLVLSQEAQLKKIVFEVPQKGEIAPPLEIEFKGGPIRLSPGPYSLSIRSESMPSVLIGGRPMTLLEIHEFLNTIPAKDKSSVFMTLPGAEHDEKA